MKKMGNLDLLTASPYDDSFPEKLLEGAFDYRIQEANFITRQICHEVKKQVNGPTPLVTEGEEKMRLVVNTTDEFMEDYKNGTIKLCKEKGKLVAQLRVNNKFGSKLPIREETYMTGPDSLNVSNALQLKSLQEAVATITEQIQMIDENIREVLIGQQNDRMGLYYSGVALYIEAMNVADEGLQKQLVAQAVKALSDSSFQLTLNMQSDIAYLKNKQFNNDKRNKYNLIQEKMNNINQSFQAIHQASVLKVAIYCQMGELKAMGSVLQQYARLVEGTIAANAYLLEQCNPKESLVDNGVWNDRAKLKLDVDGFIKSLNEPAEVIYLENTEE